MLRALYSEKYDAYLFGICVN